MAAATCGAANDARNLYSQEACRSQGSIPNRLMTIASKNIRPNRYTALKARAGLVARLLESQALTVTEIMMVLGISRSSAGEAISLLRGKHALVTCLRCLYIQSWQPPPSPSGKGQPVPSYRFGYRPDAPMPKKPSHRKGGNHE